MPEQSGCQIRELLPASLKQMEGTLKNELCKDPGVSQSRLAWGFVGSEATEAVQSVLNGDVFELVAQGW